MTLTSRSNLKLNNDIEIPRLGLGVYQSGRGSETVNAVRWALEAGYCHVDTARFYGNEAEVGQAIRESGIAREEVFVTTKLWNSDHGYDRTLKAFEQSRQALDLEYIDLFLVHWPVQDRRLDTWRALERIYEEGGCRAIGVSNYMVPHLGELLANCKVSPAVNQFELTPFNYASREEICSLCREEKIQIETYSPLTKGQRLDDERLVKIGSRYGKSTAQVLIRWALQHDFVVIPKSSHKERIIENAAIFDFELSSDEMQTLDDMDENYVTSWDPMTAP